MSINTLTSKNELTKRKISEQKTAKATIFLRTLSSKRVKFVCLVGPFCTCKIFSSKKKKNRLKIVSIALIHCTTHYMNPL